MLSKFKGIIIIVLTIVLSSSCAVLKKKDYQNLLSRRDSLQNELNSTKISRDSLISLNEKLNSDIMHVKEVLQDMQRENDSIFKNYKDLRFTSSGNIKKLTADLEARENRLKELEAAMKARSEANQALKEKISNALLRFKESGLSVHIKDGKVYVSLTDKLLFSTGSIIIDENGKKALEELSKVLQAQSDLNIFVQGHTDNARVINLGAIKDNWDLSVLRATSVARYLSSTLGIDPGRIEASGKSQYAPLEEGDSPDIRSKNRRIEIILSPKLDDLYKLIEN